MIVIDYIQRRFLALPKRFKIALIISLDCLLIVLSVWLAFYLRIGELPPIVPSSTGYYPLFGIALSLILLPPIFWKFGVYRNVMRHSDGASLKVIAIATAIFSVIYMIVITLFGVAGVPRTIGIIQPILFFILIAMSRIVIKYLLSKESVQINQAVVVRQILIYGTGSTGREMASSLLGSGETSVLGFIDDDLVLKGRRISGLPIYSPSDLSHLVKKTKIDEIFIAMPSVGRRKRQEIVRSMKRLGVSARSMPIYDDVVNERVTFTDIRETSIEEILDRPTVEANPEVLGKDINEKTIMVTGAGGSIGSELCRQVIHQHPKKLILFEQNEFALFSINKELQKINLELDFKCEIWPILGSIGDNTKVNHVMKSEGVSTVYHAAAYKHVHLVEINPLEGMLNNVIGTMLLANSACAHGVHKFILVSTDKAVRPTSVMGASKRLAEMVLQALSTTNKSTTFAMVRFGNVLGSSGSVVPLFREQIANGGPVTVTHPEVTRYFMTVSEAAQLVIQAGAMTEYVSKADKNSDLVAPVYLLDMGNPVKIRDLAKRMIELSGLSVFDKKQNPDGDIEVKFTGLRSGEKLYEELLIGESISQTSNPKIFVASEDFLSINELTKLLSEIEACISDCDIERMKACLKPHFGDLGIINDS